MADNNDEVLVLLQIADLAKEWPSLRPLHNHAMDALQKISDEQDKEDSEARKAAKEKAEKEKAELEAKALREAAKQQAETKTGATSTPSVSATSAKDEEDEKPKKGR